MEEFKDVLAKLRKEKGLSQRKLSEELNLSHSAISNYEQGIREPNFETLECIADYFNVDMGYLLGKSKIRNESIISGDTYIQNNSDQEHCNYFNNLNTTPKHKKTLNVISRASKNMSEEELDKMMNLLNAAFDGAFKDDNNDEL